MKTAVSKDTYQLIQRNMVYHNTYQQLKLITIILLRHSNLILMIRANSDVQLRKI